MPTLTMIEKVNIQINQVSFASQWCLTHSTWCAAHALQGSATLMRECAQRNISQMTHLFNFSRKHGIIPVVNHRLPEYCEYSSLVDLLQQALDNISPCHQTLSELESEAFEHNNLSAGLFFESLNLQQYQESQLLHTALIEAQAAQRQGADLQQIDSQLLALLDKMIH